MASIGIGRDLSSNKRNNWRKTGEIILPKDPEDEDLTELALFDYDRHYPTRIMKVSPEELDFLRQMNQYGCPHDFMGAFDDDDIVHNWINTLQAEHDEGRRKRDIERFIIYW